MGIKIEKNRAAIGVAALFGEDGGLMEG